MNKIRVLVVDDSSTACMMLTRFLEQDRAIEIAGTAQNGREALEKITRLSPDVMLLDFEMPELDGLSTLKALRDTGNKIPVIMFSRFTTRGAVETIEALFCGADDYVSKPESSSAFVDCVDQELLPRIKALSGQTAARPNAVGTPSELRPLQSTAASDSSAFRPIATSRRSQQVEALVVAASTGGPSVLADIFSSVPRNLPFPVLLVQHMPRMFTGPLADSLQSKTGLITRVATHDRPLTEANIWVAPGDQHMSVVANANELLIKLDNNPPENECRPAADVLFRSAARVFQKNVMAIVLTGMGDDGLEGCRAISEVGGSIMVQDESSSVCWGMPGSVSKAGLADLICSPSEIAEFITLISAGRNRWL